MKFRIIFTLLATAIVVGWYVLLGDSSGTASSDVTSPTQSNPQPTTPNQPFSAPPQ